MRRIGIITLILLLLVGFFLYRSNIYALGLRVLSFYKFSTEAKLDYGSWTKVDWDVPSYKSWDNMLKKYVLPNGDVDYKGWQEEKAALRAWLKDVSIFPPSHKWTEEQQLAHWINLYNAYTILLVLDHYPIASIKDIQAGTTLINSVWDLKFFEIGGRKMDLNTLEHGILRKEFDEPAIHFAINCASYSCPKLRNEAYSAALLANQLEDQSSYFILNSSKNRIAHNKWELSMIFAWYEDDFQGKEGVTDFVKQYLQVDPDADVDISYMPYNWSINEVEALP
ncbi:MAG: DUF547 domain-containing protein [Bacteroidota bacterium]